MPGVRARAAFLAYRAGAELARAVPRAQGEVLTRGVSRLMMTSSTARRKQVERNLRRTSAGELHGDSLRRATRSVFDHYGRYWHELFRMAAKIPRDLDARVAASGLEHLDAAVAAGQGAIVALPHLGNWDVAGAWFAARGYQLTVVVEPTESLELFEWFISTRERLGMEVIVLGNGAASAVVRALHRNRVICLLSDRDLSGDGVSIEFFGETTTLPGGPATLALRTGAPLLPAGIYFETGREAGPGGRSRGERYRVEIRPPIPAVRQGRLRDDVGRVTQELASCFEQLIRAAPDQWLVLQPNWPSDRPGELGDS